MKRTVVAVHAVLLLLFLVLPCQSDTTIQDVISTTAAASEVTTEATNATDTITEATNATEAVTSEVSTENVTSVTTDYVTTDYFTLEPLLNISDSFEDYWLKTVLSVPLEEDVETLSWRREMERRLSVMFDEAIRIRDLVSRSNWNSYNSRRKRYVTTGQATIQTTNISRSSAVAADRPAVDVIYYLVEDYGGSGGYNITPAADTMFLLNQFDDQEVALRLGYYVISKGEVYNPVPEPSTPMYWIIGAVLGGVLVLVLIVWIILFTYIKCTRTDATTNSRSSRRVGDSKTNLVPADKKTQGFDIIRHTEEGLQNGELQAAHPGAAHPGAGRGVTPQQQQSVHAGPGYPHEATILSEQQTLQQKAPGQRGQPPPSRGQPSGRGRGRGHHPPANRGSPHPSYRGGPEQHRARAEMYGYGDEEVVRSSVHHLPPLTQQPLVGEAQREEISREQKEMHDSLRQKADIERWRNKQRLRDRKKKKKEAKQARSGDVENDNRASGYLAAANEEIDAVLGESTDLHSVPEVLITKPEKKRRSKPRSSSHDVAGADPEHMEMKDMFGPAEPKAKYKPLHQQKHMHNGDRGLGDLQSATDSAGGEETDVEETRQHMHELLDEAFSLAHNKPTRNNRVQPSISSTRKPGPRSSSTSSVAAAWQADTIQPQQSKGVAHTPLHLAGSGKHDPVPAWSPYTAADTLAKIDPHMPRHRVPDPAIASVQSTQSMHAPPPPPPRPSFQQPKLHQPPPSVDDYTSIVMDTRTLNQSASRTHSSQLPVHSFRPVKEDHIERRRLSADASIDKATKPGASPQPLVDSIREDLHRLSQRSSGEVS